MSTRSRAKPWFSKAPTLREIERAAQLHYGWEDWNDPFQKVLQDAESRYQSEELERFFWNIEDASAEALRLRVHPLPWEGVYSCDLCKIRFRAWIPDPWGINQDVPCPQCRHVQTWLVSSYVSFGLTASGAGSGRTAPSSGSSS